MHLFIHLLLIKYSLIICLLVMLFMIDLFIIIYKSFI